MLITQFDQWGDEPDEIYIEFSQSAGHGIFRERLAAAWRVVLGRDPWLHSIVLQGEGIEQLRAAINGRGGR